MSEETTLDSTGASGATSPASTHTSNQTPSPQAQGKVWTDEYVQGLREEAKTNRLAKKAAEAKLRALIGLKDDEEIDDAKISAYQQAQQTALNDTLQKANDRLILSEIRSIEGYDHKLVERLLTDKSNIKISDDGIVTGVKEAIAALEAEFPQIKLSKQAPLSSGANPPGAGGATKRDELIQAYNEAEKRRDVVMMQNLQAQIKSMKT